MTDREVQAADQRRGRPGLGRVTLQGAVTVLSVVLAVALVVVLGLRIAHPEALSPARAAATSAQDRDEEVTSAARRIALAFLDIDYRDMDQRTRKVLALATGQFKREYQSTVVQIEAVARQGQAVSSGQIRYIGITDIDADAAVVYVAADQTVSNLAIEQARKKGKKVSGKRPYRFQFNMSRVGGRWLVSELQVVV